MIKEELRQMQVLCKVELHLMANTNKLNTNQIREAELKRRQLVLQAMGPSGGDIGC